MTTRPLRKGDVVKYIGHHSKCTSTKCNGHSSPSKVGNLYRVVGGRQFDGGVRATTLDGTMVDSFWREHIRRVEVPKKG